MIIIITMIIIIRALHVVCNTMTGSINLSNGLRGIRGVKVSAQNYNRVPSAWPSWYIYAVIYSSTMRIVVLTTHSDGI